MVCCPSLYTKPILKVCLVQCALLNYTITIDMLERDVAQPYINITYYILYVSLPKPLEDRVPIHNQDCTQTHTI